MGLAQNGAHLYVCGDAERMARNVDRGLAYIIAKKAAWMRPTPKPISLTSPAKAAMPGTSIEPSLCSPRCHYDRPTYDFKPEAML